MIARKFVFVSLAALLLSTPFIAAASAASAKHVHHARSHSVHSVKHSTRAPRAAAPGADHSADALNGQSLQRSQTGQ